MLKPSKKIQGCQGHYSFFLFFLIFHMQAILGGGYIAITPLVTCTLITNRNICFIPQLYYTLFFVWIVVFLFLFVYLFYKCLREKSPFLADLIMAQLSCFPSSVSLKIACPYLLTGPHAVWRQCAVEMQLCRPSNRHSPQVWVIHNERMPTLVSSAPSNYIDDFHYAFFSLLIVTLTPL